MNRLMKTSLLLLVLGVAQCHALAPRPLDSKNDSSDELLINSVVETPQNQELGDTLYTIDSDTSAGGTDRATQPTANSAGFSNLMLFITISLAILHLILMRTDRRHQ